MERLSNLVDGWAWIFFIVSLFIANYLGHIAKQLTRIANKKDK